MEQYIAECIESVLSQSYSNFELVLIDDGSTDKSGAVCDDYSIKDSRIITFHINNQGALHARVFGIEKATGDFYIFLDSDDTLKSNALEVIANSIKKYNCDTVIYGFERVYDGRVISQTFDQEEVCLKTKRDLYNQVFFELDKNAMCRKAVKADVFKGEDYSPYYHIKMGEDLLQSLEVYKYSNTTAFIPNILYEYRMNPQSMTHTNRISGIDFTVRKKVLEFLQSENVFLLKEFDRYKDFCIGLFVDTIIIIGIMNTPIIQKKDLFMQIRQDDYYNNFLSKGITDRKSFGYKKAVYDLFKNKHDALLLTLLSIYGKINQ